MRAAYCLVTHARSDQFTNERPDILVQPLLYLTKDNEHISLKVFDAGVRRKRLVGWLVG